MTQIDTQQEPVSPDDEGKKFTTRSIPNYVVVRSGNKFEPLFADNDEQMREIIQRQVRTGQVPAMYVYKLFTAELFEPSSRNVEGTPEEIKEKASNKL